MENKHKRYLKANLISLFFVAVSFISVTLAWFAYSGFAKSGFDVDIKAWHIEFNGKSTASNEIVIPLSNIYPGMDTVIESVNIKNKGDSDAKLSYLIESVRILDDELEIPTDQNIIIDKLSNNYPFKIDISLSKEYVDANIGEASIDLAVSWPLDSDNNKDDSIWGNKTYEFQQNELKLENDNKDYKARTSIKVVISLIAEQNMDKFILNTGNMVLYNPELNDKCEKNEGSCYRTNMITPYYDDSEDVVLLPNILNEYSKGTYDEYETNISKVTENWVVDNRLLHLKDIIKVVSTDVHNTKLIRENLSEEIVGYITEESRFNEYINTKVIPNKYNSHIKFNSTLFDYLDTNKCYWLEYEMPINEDEQENNKAFALTKESEGIMNISILPKETECYMAPILLVPREKLYSK